MTVPPPPSSQSPSSQSPSSQPSSGQPSSGPASPGPSSGGQPSGPADPGDDPEERDVGPARERTTLAWIRTALAFTAVGAAMLKVNVITGLIVLAVGPVVWQLGRVIRGSEQGASLPAIGATRLFIIAVSIVAVALLCMIVAIFGKSVPGALR